MNLLVPAKVNLHLQILGKRADGYHEIQTLMVRIGVFDELEMTFGGEGLQLTLEGIGLPGGGENLVLRAARTFFQELGIPPADLTIRLRKKIPVAAGLGGGSSDAASTLLGLNEMLEARLDRKRLMALGKKIGADVPFFIFEKPALARGIGEQLTEVVLPESLWFFLVVPPFQISTAWAYEFYDRLGPIPRDPKEIFSSFGGVGDLSSILENDLERPVILRYPQIAEMKGKILSQGAKGALMSGSGSVVFGIFPTQEEAERARQEIPLPGGWKGMVTHRL